MIGKLFDKVLHYFQIKIDVLKLNLVQRIAVVMGFCMLMVLGMMLLCAVLLFMGMGLSEYFGVITESIAAGYFIVTGIYLVLLGVIFILRKHFQRWFAGLFISLLTTDDDDNEENPA